MRMQRAVGVSAATMASRVLGLIRDLLFAALIGANRYSDAFVVAFRIPNLLRDLFAEGALSAAFVPTFAEYEHKHGRHVAYQLAGTLIAVVLVVVGGITLTGILFARPLVAGLAPGFDPAQADLTAHLARVMMPYLLLVSLSAVAMGMLNAQGSFTAPALAPALFNTGSIAAGVALWLYKLEPRAAVVAWSLGALLGGVLQLSAQLPSLWRAGFRLTLRLSRAALSEPGLRRIGGLMAAAVLGLSATQVNIIVNTYFASNVDRATTYLQLGFRLMQLPLGVFGVAVATVAGAGVAQRAAANDMDGVRRTLGSAMRLVAFFNIPSAIGLIVLADPIVALIFQHGRFTAGDTRGTAAALVYYSVGLYGYSAVKVFAPAFYAVGAARIPVVGSVLGMLANVILNVTLFPVLSYKGVALGTSLAATLNFMVLAYAWRTRFGGLADAGLYRQLAQVLAAAAVTAIVAWGTMRLLASYFPGHGFGAKLVIALVPVAVGALAYVAAARALGISELSDVWGVIRRRRRATASAEAA
jgi:putative peptidoglycan lipid II flippase